MADTAKKMESKPTLTKDDVLSIAEASDDSLSLIQSRFQALGHYLDAPIPSRAEHLWRYSDPAGYFPKQLLITAPTKPAPESVRQRSEAAILETRGQTTQADDNCISLFSDRPPEIRQAAADGLTIEPLAHSAEGAALIGQAVPLDHGIFESLNGAIWNQGIFVKLEKGVHLDQPVRIRRIASSRVPATRLVVVIEPGASMTLVEEHTGGGNDVSVLATSEIFAGQDARVTHALFQLWDKGTVGHVTSRARLARDSLLRSAVVSFGGARYKADVGAVLEGLGAQSDLAGVSLTDSRRHVDLHTVHDHRGQRTHSRIVYKSALFDRSTSAYTGLIRVAESAELSEAFQENRNLLLSDRCQADSIPELEIETREVQCTHAATAAPIDEGQLFYLKSRGIREDDAVGIMVRGFFEDALRSVPEQLKPEIERAVTHRLAERYRGDRS